MITPPTEAEAPEGHPEELPEQTPGRWRWLLRRGPFIAVGLTVAFNLWALHPNVLTVPFGNDSSVHLSMARWAELRITEGHLPFDGWFPYLDLGAPRFHHYQSLPAIGTGAIGALVGVDGAFHWITYLLLALWPICVFWSARLLGWGRWPSAIAAVVSPLVVSQPGLGYEWSSYTWGGYGLYTQLWGMWLMPFSWALTWRAVSGRGPAWPAALVASLCIAAHFITGYLALLVLGAWVLIKPSELLRRAGRAALVGGGALLAASWVLVPLLADAAWTTRDAYAQGNPAYDSYGALRVLRWLGTGALFDRGRWPVVTVLLGFGLVVCVARFRRDERARALLAVATLSSLLYFGRPTLGPALDLLPGSGDVFLRRYLLGVHLAGILLAGVGAAAAGRYLARGLRRVVGRVTAPRVQRWKPALVTALVAVVAVAWTAPGFVDRGRYAMRQFGWIASQRADEDAEGADVRALISRATGLGPGRLFAGQGGRRNPEYKVGFVPLDLELLDAMVDAVGFNRPTWSLSSGATHNFDAHRAAHYRLFGVRYLIEPAGDPPLVSADRVATRGEFTLYEIASNGYFDLVHVRPPPIRTDRLHLGPDTESFLRSALPALGLFPAVSFAGAPAAPPTTGRAATKGPPSSARVLDQRAEPQDGWFRATVTTPARLMLVLKSSFDPRWHVEVDGRAVEPQMVAPSFVGREVEPGRHVVTFEYAPYPGYGLLLPLSALAVVLLALLDRRLARRRTRAPLDSAPGGAR